MRNFQHNRGDFQEISTTTNTKSRADLFRNPNKEQLNTECTNPDLAMNDAIDGMTIFNCGYKFHNALHLDSVKQYEVWPDNLVQQQVYANLAIE